MFRYLEIENECLVPTDYYYNSAHIVSEKIPVQQTHVHNYYEIFYYSMGKGEFLLGNQVIDILDHDVIIVPPNCLHNIISSENKYDRLYLHITDAYLQSMQFQHLSILKELRKLEKDGILHFNIADEKYFDRIRLAINMIGANRKEFTRDECELENRGHILHALALTLRSAPKKNRSGILEEQNQFISKIIDYINENYEKPISIDQLCQEFFTNRHYVTKLFKDYTTMTIHNYIQLTRISRAKLLLNENKPPTKIFGDCGFQDYSTFYRTFKKIEGVSPEEFANRLKI